MLNDVNSAGAGRPRPAGSGRMSAPRTHRYEATCHWSGSTRGGYANYDRSHRATAPPAEVALTLSSAPEFLGDPGQVNPEQLVVLAAASCQLLSFLAVAARARVDVVAYEDRAEGLMPEGEGPIRIEEIRLRPRITVRAPASEPRVRALVEVAHRECYISNSLSSRVIVEPQVEVLAS
jgi:organic hydroperoxide reductase OsmC/OhrA